MKSPFSDLVNEKTNITSFEYCLKSGRQWNFYDYYELYEFKDNTARFRVYDANLFPSPNFETWSKEAIAEVANHVKNRFKSFDGIIFLDNYKIDLTGGSGMREIKFRAWVYEYEDIFDVVEINFIREALMIIGDAEEYYFGFDEVELMQYTGFKDKNGVEIYEGDIVELKYHRDRRYKVKAKTVYSDEISAMVLKYENDLTTEEYPLYKITANNYLEVVGNIYENKELIE